MVRKKNRTAPREYVDAGTPERARHGDTEARVVYSTAGHAIGHGRRVVAAIERIALDGEMLDAAERLRRQYDLAIWQVSDTSSPDVRIRSNLPPTLLPDAVIDAGRWLAEARRVMGPCEPVVIAVVCEDVSLSVLAQARGQDRQELAGVLKAGLAALARWRGR